MTLACCMTDSHFSLGCTGAIDPANPVAGGNFSVQVDCQSELTSGMTHGDEILLVRHRVGADVVAAIGAEHPVPKGTLREFSRLSLSHGGQPGQSSFQLGVDSFALTDNAGRSILYPGTHYIDVSPREPGNAWSLTVTVGGKAKAILATPPPLPKST